MKALGKGSIASIVRIGLQVAWWGLWLASGLLAAAAVSYGVILALIASGAMDPSILEANRDAQVQIPGITLDNPPDIIWPVVVPGMLNAGVAIGGGLVIVGRLKQLFDNFTSGEPFRRENASHLRAIWIAMLAIEISRFALLALAGALLAAFGPDEIERTVSLSIDISTWASIFILIVLAEVFREGARLKEEQELTI
ncbi:MAG: DUF2975 domain-containing protein [Vitreimonas sp.]